MAQRFDLASSQRLVPDEWLATASAAQVRRDRTGLETLLRIELASAVAKAEASKLLRCGNAHGPFGQ